VSRSKSSFVSCVSGTLLQPKAGMILRMAIMDCQGHLFPSPFQFWVEKDSHHNKSESDIFVASGVILACWNVAQPLLFVGRIWVLIVILTFFRELFTDEGAA